MFSRFEQLDELMLGGTWFRPETPAELDLPPATKPWKLAKLKVPRQHTELLRMCPELRVLELSPFPFGGTPSSMVNAASCANLQELRFVGGGFNMLDFGTVLLQIRALTMLGVRMWDQDQFFHLDVLVDAAIAPGLRHLELDFLSAQQLPADQVELAAPHQERLVRILNSRGQLETFELKGIAVRADTFFSSMDGEASTPRCPCHHVKKLNLEIYMTPAMDTDPIVSQEVWSLIYTQLRAVGALRILTLVCPDIHSTVERGFEVLGKMATLAELSLVDPTRPPWLTTFVEAIVAAAPRLKSMSLRPLTDASRDLINGWLTERKKTDLRF
ncbi:hypothetical protein BGW39_011836 [Mortierella sp. 14UC]|nr:hypothetical protein BGW39_011836 [Mortierella sp. 14UC]